MSVAKHQLFVVMLLILLVIVALGLPAARGIPGAEAQVPFPCTPDSTIRITVYAEPDLGETFDVSLYYGSGLVWPDVASGYTTGDIPVCSAYVNGPGQATLASIPFEEWFRYEVEVECTDSWGGNGGCILGCNGCSFPANSSAEWVITFHNIDLDYDFIVDDDDGCPDEPEHVDGVYDFDGCPETSIQLSQETYYWDTSVSDDPEPFYTSFIVCTEPDDWGEFCDEVGTFQTGTLWSFQDPNDMPTSFTFSLTQWGGDEVPWLETTLDCVGGSLSSSVLSLGFGEDAVCTFVSYLNYAHLNVDKIYADQNPALVLVAPLCDSYVTALGGDPNEGFGEDMAGKDKTAEFTIWAIDPAVGVSCEILELEVEEGYAPDFDDEFFTCDDDAGFFVIEEPYTNESCTLINKAGDLDGDGVPDETDLCPDGLEDDAQLEDLDGIDDDDGCAEAQVTVTKSHATPSDGGVFDLLVDNVVAPLGDAAGDGDTTEPVGLLPGFHSIGEIADATSARALDAYARAISCLAAGGAQIDSETESTYTFEVSDAAAAADLEIECTITNTIHLATVTIDKDFSDDSDETVEITLSCDAGTVHTLLVNPGDYAPGSQDNTADATETRDAVFTVLGAPSAGMNCTASEPDRPDYEEDATACEALGIAGTVSAEASCTMVNTAITTVRVTKDFLNDPEPEVTVTITLSCDGGTIEPTDPQIASDEAPVEFKLTGEFESVVCTAAEDNLPEGYELVSSDCEDMDVPARAVIECTIENTTVASITVHKDFEPEIAEGVLIDITCGSGNVETLGSATAFEAGPSATFELRDFADGATSCTISEPEDDRVAQAEVTCAINGAGGDTYLASSILVAAINAGDEIVCTFTNTLNQATVTVDKDFADNNGVASVTVKLTCAGAAVVVANNAVATELVDASFTVYGIPEPAGVSCEAHEDESPEGYARIGGSCGVFTLHTTGHSCTILNSPNQATISVSKVWQPAASTPVNVTVACNGVSSINGEADEATLEVTPGTPGVFTLSRVNEDGIGCSVSEPVIAGTAVAIDCGSFGAGPGNLQNLTALVLPDDEVVCTITNTSDAEPGEDSDGDGIADTVDEQPGVPSTRFSDIATGGATAGEIITLPGGMDVTISDEPAPGGLRVEVAGGLQVTIALDGKTGVYVLPAGTYVLTDPEATVEVETILGGPAQVTIPLGNPPLAVEVPAGSTAKIVEVQDGQGNVLGVTVEALEGPLVFGGMQIPQGSGIEVETPAACQGVSFASTILGTAGGESLSGTSGADLIIGLDGNDYIDGRGGSDCIIGGPGNDHLVGAAGQDTLDGGEGQDLLEGGPGTDQLDGGSGLDYCTGEQLTNCELPRVTGNPVLKRLLAVLDLLTWLMRRNF